MPERIAKGSELTLRVIDKIKNHKNIIEISHPSIKTHKTYSLYKFKLYPSVFTLTIKNNIRSTNITNIRKYIETASKINLIISFGGKKSKIDPWPKVNKKIRLRISIGYMDNVDYIVNELNKIIS